MIGLTLGPYQVTSKLGEGGMGEVYRAHDSRLNREVAIKVLPSSFAADPERLQRFETEAQAAGRLNHPNVLTVYDVGTHEGSPYLVTELLEGETLRQRLTSAAGADAAQTVLPVRKVVDIGRQLALGLAAAHGASIVHRDLKPENIFLTGDGRVKILDFGLARMAEPKMPDGSAATALQVTTPGIVLGTVGYMSPEQVRGQMADARSDLFALGAILFEMAGGRRAFQRTSSAETMAAILKEEPPELSTTGVLIPPGLDRVIRRCLEKNPDERFQSARDLAFALEAIDGSSSSMSSASGLHPAMDAPVTVGRRVPMLVVGLVGLAAVVAAYMAGSAGRSAGSDGSASSAFRMQQLTFGASALTMPAVSSDGSNLLYVMADGDDFDIFLQRVGGETAINLTKDSPVNDMHPAFSPDGRQIAFSSLRSGGGIFVMGPTGESVRRLTTEGFNPAWSPDGKELAYSTEGVYTPFGRSSRASLWRVVVATGEKTKVYDGDAVQPSWSPDGSRLAFWGLPPGSGHRAIWTIPATGGDPTLLIDDDAANWRPVWSPDGAFIYYLSDRQPPMNLWRMPIDPATGAATGPPERVTLGTSALTWLSEPSNGAMAVSASNRVDTLAKRAMSLSAATVDLPQTILRTARALGFVGVSRDGKSIAMMATDATEDIVAMNADGSGLIRLTNDAFRDRSPAWSWDASTIYFRSDRSGRYEVWRIHRDGSGLEQVTQATADGMVLGELQVSPDDRLLAVMVANESRTVIADLTVPIAQRTLTPVSIPGQSGTFMAHGWFPDGRLAGVVFEGGVPKAVAAYRPGDASAQVVSIEGVQVLDMVGDRYFVIADPKTGLVLLDLTTGARRTFTIKGPFFQGGAYPADNGSLIVTIESEEIANIWTIRR